MSTVYEKAMTYPYPCRRCGEDVNLNDDRAMSGHRKYGEHWAPATCIRNLAARIYFLRSAWREEEINPALQKLVDYAGARPIWKHLVAAKKHLINFKGFGSEGVVNPAPWGVEHWQTEDLGDLIKMAQGKGGVVSE